jgi:antitoxin (DNA-binding transcriptional repressor) of toxin-antitoxin stability system
MTTVGDLDARARLPQLLEKVEAGETVVITRDGRPVAHLVPAPAAPPKAGAAALIEQWIEARKGVTLGGLRVRDLIEEGRR